MASSRKRYCANPQPQAEDKVLPKSCKRRRKQAEGEESRPVQPLESNSDPWHTAVSPTSLQDLAVDVRKQNELKTWLSRLCSYSEIDEAFAEPGQCVSRIAAIKGPAGCGKTLTVRLVAQSLGIEVIEFVPNTNTENQLHHDYDDSGSASDKKPYELSHTQKFESFLRDSCRYNTDPKSAAKRLVMVKDLPHVFVMDPTAFQSLLRRIVRLYPNHTPIAFLLTSCLSNCNEYRLFPFSITSELNITSINFNRVSNALLKKALKRLPVCETIPPAELDAIISTSAGDLRTAFNEVELRFTRCDTASSDSCSNPQGAKVDLTGQLLSQRQLFSSSFHYFGKVLYAKRCVDGAAPADGDEVAKRKFPLLTSPDLLIRERSCSSTTLLLKLHQNYVKRTKRIEEVARCSDLLSQAELISRADFQEDKPHFQEYLADISIRGLMYALPPTLVNSKGKIISQEPTTAGSSQLLLQKALKFYEYDNFCKTMNKMSLEQPIPDSSTSVHTSRDLFFDILPCLSHQVQTQTLQRSYYNVLVSAISQMKERREPEYSAEGDEEEGSRTSHVIQSNYVADGLGHANRAQASSGTKKWEKPSENIKGLGKDEDMDDYHIDDE